VNIVVLTYTGALVGFQRKIVSSVHGHGQDKIPATCQSLYLPTDAQESCCKRMFKFTLKQLLQVSVQSPSSGSTLVGLAKVMVVKIIC